MVTGYPDIPITTGEQNDFKTGNYIDVMVDFIKQCDTPMTIAIQGDWGTGKTSMMNLIKENLGSDVHSIMFNTWQYSQFNLGNQLPILLINKLVSSLADEGIKASIKDKLIKGAKIVGNTAISAVSQGNASIDFDQFDPDQIEQLINIREELQKIITTKAMSTKAKRVVIFVDDLDRLQPEKAVEVLEVMKIFLDCTNCVFVLAVDYAVVSRGVSAKYGESISDEKGKSFFDKIIQLPFKMPVAQYTIDEYLKRLMTNIWGTIDDDEELDIRNYLRIIDCTIGKNPRSIKRTVNSFTIIDNVAEKEHAYLKDTKIVKKSKQKVLFCLLCMQLSCEPLYNYIMENTNRFIEDKQMFLDELENDEKFCETLKDIYEKEHAKKEITMESQLFIRLNMVIDIFVEWSLELIELLNKDNKTNNSEDEYLKILTFSSITSSSTIPEQLEDKKERNMYYLKFDLDGEKKTVAFRSAMRNASSLGALAYVLIKQYILNHDLTTAEVNKMLVDARISGSFLNEEEPFLFEKQSIIAYIGENSELFEHFLTHYFVEKYQEALPELEDYLTDFSIGVSGMQQTFGPIIINAQTIFVARYWSENGIQKLVKTLGFKNYINTDSNMITENITAFSKEEINEMSKRKCGFKFV